MSEKLIGISTDGLQMQFGILRALEICAAAGFDGVDVSLDPYEMGKTDLYRKSDEEIVDHFQQVKKRADELGLRISQTHGVCDSFRPREKMHNDWVVDVTRRDLLASSVLGAPACVIHSISTYFWIGSSPEVMRAQCLRMYRRLLPMAEEYGVKIALETFGDCRIDGRRTAEFFGDVRELKAVYDELDTEWKTFCVDTGHTHRAWDFDHGQMDAADAIRYLGADVSLLHLNDNNGASDQHLPPLMAGDSLHVNWKDVMAALDEIEYKGVYNFEFALNRLGRSQEEAVMFLGKFLRRFVNGSL